MDWNGVSSGVAVAVAAAATLGVVAAVRVRSIGQSASEHPVHDLRVAWRQVSVVSVGLGGGAAWVVVSSVRWHHIIVASAAATIAAAVFCLVLPASVSRRPLAVAIARARGVDIKATRSFRSAAVGAIRLAMLLWPVALVLAVNTSLAVRAAIVASAYLVVNPVVTGLLTPVTARIIGPGDMPAEVRDRLSALAAQAGLTVRGRLIRARARKRAAALQSGWIPGLRYVLVTDYLIDHMPLAEIDAILAHELAHARSHDGVIRTFLLTAPDVLMTLALVALVSRRETLAWIFLIAGVVAMFGLLRLARDLAIRQEFAADEKAAATVGPMPMAAALRRLIDLNQIRPDTSPAYERQVGHPAISRRLARLEKMATAAAQPAG